MPQRSRRLTPTQQAPHRLRVAAATAAGPAERVWAWLLHAARIFLAAAKCLEAGSASVAALARVGYEGQYRARVPRDAAYAVRQVLGLLKLCNGLESQPSPTAMFVDPVTRCCLHLPRAARGLEASFHVQRTCIHLTGVYIAGPRYTKPHAPADQSDTRVYCFGTRTKCRYSDTSRLASTCFLTFIASPQVEISQVFEHSNFVSDEQTIEFTRTCWGLEYPCKHLSSLVWLEMV